MIELLVVIAIIALLLSILVPALSRARRSARMVVCSSNLKGLTMGLVVYAASDKLNRFPQRNGIVFPNEIDLSGQPATPPVETLCTYVANKQKELLFCPLRDRNSTVVGVNPGLDLRTKDASAYMVEEREIWSKYFYVSWVTNGLSSYWVGYNVYAGLMGSTGVWSIDWTHSGNSNKKEPLTRAGGSKDIIASDYTYARMSGGWFAAHAKGLSGSEFDRDRGAPFPVPDPGCNAAYSDGHVEYHKKATNYISTPAGWCFFW